MKTATRIQTRLCLANGLALRVTVDRADKETSANVEICERGIRWNDPSAPALPLAWCPNIWTVKTRENLRRDLEQGLRLIDAPETDVNALYNSIINLANLLEIDHSGLFG